ncbi:SH3 domain-containing protein [Thiohalophilus sp.]|uniref:SH3 domain-containing protein n=1 Tax=Thiohalophilus sp. TaxID=3028392 RepID=UPI002ACD497F|nr:SH3 domain-containing protein [Thiohalophilus sp.]MDZ7802606.1 SH3 domain-containing protein [Thiohalophilus sp.]
MTGSSTTVRGLLLVMLLLSSPVVALAALVPFVQQFETREAVTVRSTPDTGADVVATLPAGSQLRSKKRSSDGRWIQVRLQQPAVTGYVRTRHLQRRSTASQSDSRIDLPANPRPSNYQNDPLAEAIRKKGTASLDLGELAHSGQIEMQHAKNARERQRQRELAEARRRAKEAERRRREAEKERQRQRELAEQRRREQEMAAQQQSSGVDWWSITNQVLQSTAEINRIKQENAARTRQLAEQARREQQRQQQYRQQQQAAQRQAQSQREQWQRQQQAAAERRRQQIAAQQRRQREQQRLVEQQRRASQKLLAQSAGAASSGYSGGGSSSPSGSTGTATRTGSDKGSSSRKKQKVYEPMPEVVSRENFTWFSDRDRAIANARLKSVNDINDRCSTKGARSDGPRFSDIEQGNAPTRWSYANPDCRQNSNGKWKCSAEVRGHCYRMQ